MAELRTGDNIQGTIRNLSQRSGSGLVTVPVESLNPSDAARVLQIQIFELTDQVRALTDQVFALTGYIQQSKR